MQLPALFYLNQVLDQLRADELLLHLVAPHRAYYRDRLLALAETETLYLKVISVRRLQIEQYLSFHLSPDYQIYIFWL